MTSPWLVVELTAEQTHPVRLAVLRADTPTKEVRFAEDDWPGAVHLGQETSSDTLYIDIAFVTLPSGNGFMIPLKVWRNRLRGNNETLKPDVPLDFEAMDEATVRARVIAALALPVDAG